MIRITKRSARRILRRSGRILKKAGKLIPADMRAERKYWLRLTGKAFFTGAAVGAAGLDSQMVDPSSFNEERTEIGDGEPVIIVRSVPIREDCKEPASYYYNLGKALYEYSRQRRISEEQMNQIRDAFRQIAEENACEYSTIAELAYQLSIIKETQLDHYRVAPEHIAQIDLEIRKALVHG